MTDIVSLNEAITRNINESVQRLLSPMPSGAIDASLKTWVNGLILSINPSSLCIASMLEQFATDILKEKYRREFVFNLSGLFYQRMLVDGFDMTGFVQNLAHACYPGSSGKNTLLPYVVEERMLTFGDWTSALLDNKWLTTLLVLVMYGSLHHDTQSRKQTGIAQ